MAFWATLLAAALGPPPLAAQSKVEGQVINGTTRQPVANQLVQLLVVGAGMREVSTAKTDASGHFALAPSGAAAGPLLLVQTVYQGVNYRARVADRGATEITVYDATRTAPPLQIRSARIVVQAQGPKARVQEFFAIENLAQPPRTYSNSDGTFRFRLGQGAGNPTAAVLGQMNMPIPQAVQDGKSAGEFLINHALQPGLTVVMVDYDADYSAGSLALADSAEFAIERAELLVGPNSLSVESKLFKSAGTDSGTGMQKFEAAVLAGGTPLEARVSGEAAAAPPSEPAGGEGEIQTTPNSMTRVGVLLLLCLLLVLVWALGVRAAKEWGKAQEVGPESPAQKQLEVKVDALLNSMADLDELHENGKVADKPYWKERLELKAKVVGILKQASPNLLKSYASRRNPR
ncbi:MAG: hypothetical protein ABSG54_05540 [Terriglobia bacterium]